MLWPSGGSNDGQAGQKGSKGAVIVKKYEIVEGGHHGGAWKVAYADFVTAMMAFFLLMWLLNATTEDQRRASPTTSVPTTCCRTLRPARAIRSAAIPRSTRAPWCRTAASVEITTGKRPVIEQTEDGDDPVYTESIAPNPAKASGQGPVADDQDADERRSKSRSARKPPAGTGTRRRLPSRSGRPAGRAAQSPPAGPRAPKGAQEKAAFEQAAAADQ